MYKSVPSIFTWFLASPCEMSKWGGVRYQRLRQLVTRSSQTIRSRHRAPSRTAVLRALALCGFSVWAFMLGATIHPSRIVVIPGYEPLLDPRGGELALTVPSQIEKQWRTVGLRTDRILLIAIGSCASCSIPSIPPRVLSTGKVRPLVGVFSDDRVKSPKWTFGTPYSILSLPPKHYARLNAAWPARLYLLNQEASIIDVQQHSESAVQTCERWML